MSASSTKSATSDGFVDIGVGVNSDCFIGTQAQHFLNSDPTAFSANRSQLESVPYSLFTTTSTSSAPTPAPSTSSTTSAPYAVPSASGGSP